MAEHEVVVTVQIDAPTFVVWKALTDPDLVAKWMMGARVTSTWQPGASITWSGEFQGQEFADKGVVLEAEPGQLLVHTHFSPVSDAPDAPENFHELTWTLTAIGTGTRLTLIQTGAQSAAEAKTFQENWASMLDSLRATAEEVVAHGAA